jgi:FtsP/CotA-like multicopper oxidase with cupredoxin domain
MPFKNDFNITGHRPVRVDDMQNRSLIMKTKSMTFRKTMLSLAAIAALGVSASASAAVNVQCGPGNAGVDNTGKIRPAYVINSATGNSTNATAECMHLTAGDGFISMADGRTLYSFGFADVTAKASADVTLDILAANFAAPTIELQQGKDFYLSLTNVSMAMRPDLFDPHTVHFHGFPQQPPVFDGMPEGSFGVNMGSTVTYFYRLNDPGTYMYHCHQEATEHMQMGMLGNLYVKPAQDGTPISFGGKSYSKFVYNDGDGSTGYDVSKALQLGSMDHVFHELHLGVQPLPFKNMRDTYPMINGRGYPDTVDPRTALFPPPAEKVDYLTGQNVPGPIESSQPINSLVSAKKGERILLRLSNLNVTNYYTVTAQGLPMKVVGVGARQLKGATGTPLYYDTASVTIGGGESTEVMIDTSQVAPGTYFLYTTNLNYLSNFEEDNGGMMTEIVISAL